MPDGAEIESITEDQACLCNSSQSEILSWIVQHVDEIVMGTKLEIVHDPFGWIVTIDMD